MPGFNVVTGTGSAGGAVVLFVTALLCAAPAAADQTDDAFLATLSRAGVVITDRDEAIGTGHMVCDGLRRGQTTSNLVLSTMKGTNLSARSAGIIIAAAVASYCPDMGNRVGSSPP